MARSDKFVSLRSVEVHSQPIWPLTCNNIVLICQGLRPQNSTHLVVRLF